MREIFTSRSLGGAPGNRCFYLELDAENVCGLMVKFVGGASDLARSRRRLRVGVNRGAAFVQCRAPPRKRGRTRHWTRLRPPDAHPASGIPIRRARGSAPRLAAILIWEKKHV